MAWTHVRMSTGLQTSFNANRGSLNGCDCEAGRGSGPLFVARKANVCDFGHLKAAFEDEFGRFGHAGIPLPTRPKIFRFTERGSLLTQHWGL